MLTNYKKMHCMMCSILYCNFRCNRRNYCNHYMKYNQSSSRPCNVPYRNFHNRLHKYPDMYYNNRLRNCYYNHHRMNHSNCYCNHHYTNLNNRMNLYYCRHNPGMILHNQNNSYLNTHLSNYQDNNLRAQVRDQH